ncbi:MULTISPECIES: C1q-like domain-containing protein [Pseudomonas]|uniref:C1q domain-containing protein n=1 Tax=Pseudomonas lutea TaxID=243924 RepID=A0A9X8QLP3_9PSED|nr:MULTISPECIES: hypothetical protein [Pseudomonas]SER35865.1 C1q domain-containing protein [Pseudomonas lutea]
MTRSFDMGNTDKAVRDFMDNPTRATTPARGNNSKLLADTAFVMRQAGNFKDSSQLSEDTVLTADDLGKVFQLAASKVITITMPPAGQVLGATLAFFSNTFYAINFKVQGQNFMSAGTAGRATAMTLNPGESVIFTNTDGVNWFAIGGTWDIDQRSKSRLSAFRAAVSASQAIAAQTYTRVVFGAKTLDQLEEFDLATGQFTVKYPGIYEFSAEVHGSTGSVAARALDLYINGVQRARLGESSSSIGNTSLGGHSGALSLSAGDKIAVYYFSNVADSTYADGSLSWFSGRRVQ